MRYSSKLVKEVEGKQKTGVPPINLTLQQALHNRLAFVRYPGSYRRLSFLAIHGTAIRSASGAVAPRS